MPMAESCCGRPAREDVDDIGRRAVVADIITMSASRVYVTGMSSGAHHVLACNTSIFAAIGVGFRAHRLGPVLPSGVGHHPWHSRSAGRYLAGPAPVRAHRCELNAFWREVNRCGALDRPKVRSLIQAPHAPTIAVSCCSPSMTPLHRWPSFATQTLFVAILHNALDEDKTIHYIYSCAVVEKT